MGERRWDWWCPCRQAFELEAALGIWAKDWLEADMEDEMRKAAKKAIGGIVLRTIRLSKRKAKR